MKQILRSAAAVLVGLALLLPISRVAASGVNGPLTFTSISASGTPAVAGKDKVTIKGSGFNHIEAVILVQQNGSNNVFTVHNYSLTDKQLKFTIPAEAKSGFYDIQVNTDDNTGRVVLWNEQPWMFEIAASGTSSFGLQKPNGSEEYKIGDKVKFQWKSNLSSYPYRHVYITLMKLKGDSWSTSGDPYQYLESGDTNISVLNAAKTDKGKYTWKVPTGITAGKYVAFLSIQYWAQPSGSDVSSLTDWSDAPFTLKTSTPATTTPATPGSAHAIGTNVLFPDGVVYRIVAGPNRSAYTSANIFTSYKFNRWSEVVPATSGDMALSVTAPMPPRDGSLLSDKGVIYITSEGKARQPFGSTSVFNGYGYLSKNIYPAETGYLEMYPTMTTYNAIHPDGTLIVHNGTYYIMNSKQRLGVPSVAVLDSWGYWLDEAVPANTYDLATPSSTVLDLRPFDQYRY